MTYVVEVSNPRLANDSAYERWEPASLQELVARLESETSWSWHESANAAAAIVGYETFEQVDDETGRTVTAWRKTPVGAAA